MIIEVSSNYFNLFMKNNNLQNNLIFIYPKILLKIIVMVMIVNQIWY